MEKQLVENAASENGVPSRRERWALVGLAGLAAAGVQGCSDDDGGSDDEPDLDMLCQGMVDDALAEAEKQFEEEQDLDMLCADMVSAAQMAVEEPDLDALCADMVAEATAAQLPETTSQENKQYTFAELTQMCDDRDGYVQIHAACGSVNSCAGFSYGDWGEGAILSEHTCAGQNGCNGLSCVELPADEMRAGDEIMEEVYPVGGPGSCTNCHTIYGDDGERDPSKFKLWVEEGSSRTVDNWLDLSPAAQARIVAFGSHGVDADDNAYAHMAAYKDFLSRAEVERVVEHIRALEPVLAVIKTKDP